MIRQLYLCKRKSDWASRSKMPSVINFTTELLPDLRSYLTCKQAFKFKYVPMFLQQYSALNYAIISLHNNEADFLHREASAAPSKNAICFKVQASYDLPDNQQFLQACCPFLQLPCQQMQ